MKIGIDCRLINKIQNTGISRYTEFLIDYYINKFGSENVFLITNDKKFVFNKSSIVYTELKPYNIFHFFFFSKFLNNLKLDLFHIPFYSGFYKKNNKVKVVVTVHDLMYRFVKDFFGNNLILNKFKIYYFDFIVKKTLLNADLIVSVSETTKKDVFDTFGFNSFHIPEDSSIAVSNDLSVLRKYDLLDRGFYFYCGNNRPHKNINFLIEIFNTTPGLPPLVLAGKGHQNSNNVIATGIITDEDLSALYKTTIAFVFPSTYEGFGLPVLESIRSGTFVVASKIPAFLEFETNNIFFFELGNKEELLEALQKALSNNFVVDTAFLSQYEKKMIYKLNDIMISNLFKVN
ncbi:hypothetical protein B0A80_17685 [Flavobacterium tructae]|uniref:glycosyltransferase family 4 protein n=1 Tax=Flavobacterium tructae TaxID=1114873 RepID=UPI000B5BC570|nr:glycosyltransferase family 1 protein [Flavobacterium tructae]OXB20759.1 hypothetical protein B0A80_17685 [Flavobacterium tructae]